MHTGSIRRSDLGLISDIKNINNWYQMPC